MNDQPNIKKLQFVANNILSTTRYMFRPELVTTYTCIIYKKKIIMTKHVTKRIDFHPAFLCEV